MANFLQKILIAGVPVLALSFSYALASGPLFPWSPLKPGYDTVHTGRATLYTPRSAGPVPGLNDIERLMRNVEQAQRLRFRKPIRIVVSDSWGLFNRGALLGWAGRPMPVLGAALQTGTVVYLSPLVLEPGRDPGAALRHELTHALLFQQMPLRDTFDLVRLDWFEEGLAVHFGNAGDYLDDAAWHRLATERDYLFRVTGDARLGRIPPEHRGPFMLAGYRLFIAFLLNRHGEAPFFRYRDRVLAAPDRHEQAYRAVFGEPLSAGVDAFEEAVRSGAWPVVHDDAPSTP